MELKSWKTWLRPGMRIKRWVLLFLLSVTAIGVGLAMAVTWAYRHYYGSLENTTGFVRLATLQFIPHPLRELIMFAIGFGLCAYSLAQMYKGVISPLMALTSGEMGLAEIVAEHRFGGLDAPELNVVAIGGGTGLSTLLRGLKRENVNIVAVVTVSDDGGSSGRLKRGLDIPAPGDVRNCIAALSDDETLLSQLFQYRFTKGEGDLAGHSVGNLLIAALTDISGSFEQAVAESSRVLNIRGQVLPSTLNKVELAARFVDGTTVQGETAVVEQNKPIDSVYLVADDRIEANASAVEAILHADLVVLGPGSLYTSVVPNLLVPGIADAVYLTSGVVVYACNVATQHGETNSFSAEDHLLVLNEYLPKGSIDYMIINSNPLSEQAIKPGMDVEAVRATDTPNWIDGAQVITADVISESNPLRHDPQKLTSALMELGVEGPSVPAIDESFIRQSTLAGELQKVS